MHFSVESDLMDQADQLDAIYVNGAETAGHTALIESRNMVNVKINRELLEALKPECVILDPMQRSEAIVIETTDPRWAGYRQAENGLFIRMGLLISLLDPKGGHALFG